MTRHWDCAFVARNPGCLHVRAASLLDESKPLERKEVAKSVAGWIRDGLIVERVPWTDDHPTIQFGGCHVCDPKNHTAQAGLFS